jgi:ABC-2 type transport system ATP-binding protein
MEKMLVVDRVSREYPGRVAVSDISFTVSKGSIHGFLGPNGAGKSTTLKMIAGLLPISSGSIIFNGQRVEVGNGNMNHAIGIMTENPPLFTDQSVFQYLYFVAQLHKVKNLKERVDFVMSELSLHSVKDRLIGNLSRGYKQRVSLAQALVFDPQLLILDEPTNGLDPQTVVELRELIKKLASDKTILFSSHVLSEVEQLCDHMTIIHQGKIKASGSISDIHKLYHQGLVLTIGISKDQEMPDLTSFGEHEIYISQVIGEEKLFHIIFKEDLDQRAEVSKFLISKGVSLLTMRHDYPELEDIFLELTEKVL